MSSTTHAANGPQLPTPKPVYPGLGLPLWETHRIDYPSFPIGAHGGYSGADTDPLLVRELAMMSIMESLTDKQDWHLKVYDEAVVAKWRQEALAFPNKQWWDLATSAKRQHWEADGYVNLIADDTEAWNKVPEDIVSASAFDYCIEELRCKAGYFEKTGIVPTLDACATVAKSDNLVPESLHEALLSAFKILQTDQTDSPDWHPNSGEKLQDLIHPSMYPLVYRRSKVFREEVVGVEDAIIKWSGRGETISGEDEWKTSESDQFPYCVGGGIPPSFWSVKYQWLPANVAFQDDGSVRFTSYINNLHPTRYPEIYLTIEKLIETSLPMWDQCLATAVDYDERDGPGRMASRFGIPNNPDDENPLNWDPSDPKDCADVEVDKRELEDEGWEEEEDEEGGAEMLAECKWKVLRKPKLPEPPQFQHINYEPEVGKRLFDRFRGSGLQVIVKMASLELTPEKPYFNQGSWHIEGQMNEHICATALYYLDSENTTTGSLSFRMQTSSDLNDGYGRNAGYSVRQGGYHWMNSVYATEFGAGAGGACLQNYGTVETREKRLLAFPNVFQHRVSPFELSDSTKPGHRRFIALWLVDPHQRIISTANVPPQQMSWWAESLAEITADPQDKSSSGLAPELISLLQENGAQLPQSSAEAKLPEDVMVLIRDSVDRDALPMTEEEAKKHRLKLMEERSVHHIRSEDLWQKHAYSFCEH